jgi:hypothetical protein
MSEEEKKEQVNGEAQGEPVFRVEPPLEKKEEDPVSAPAEEKQAAVDKAEEGVQAVEEKAEEGVQAVEEKAEEGKQLVSEKTTEVAAEASKVGAAVENTTATVVQKAEEATKNVAEQAEKKVQETVSAADRIKANVNKYKPEKKAEEPNRNAQSGGAGNGTEKKHSAPIVLIAILLIFLVFALGYAVFPRKTKVNLDKYISVDFTGYDGYGKADVHFDSEAFLKDYRKKIKLKKKGDLLTSAVMEGYTPEAFLNDYYLSGNWKLDGVDGKYKNGDKVHLSWKIDKDKIEETFRVKIKDAGKEFEVKGLDKVEKFDAFENLSIEYSGTAPNGMADLEGKGIMDGSKGLYFSADKMDGLSNGDEITVKIVPENALEAFIQKTGKAPKETEKQFKVEGLPAYIDSASAINEENLNNIKSEMEDNIKSSVAKEGDSVQLISTEYQGYYFLKAKNKNYGIQNVFYPVYKVTVRITLPSKGFVQDYSYYVSASLQNIMDEGNGKVTIDTTDMDTVYHTFEIDTDPGNWLSNRFYLDGFESLDSLRKEVVTKQLSNFKVEEKIAGESASTEESKDAGQAESESGEAESSTEETNANS